MTILSIQSLHNSDEFIERKTVFICITIKIQLLNDVYHYYEMID